MHDVVILGGGVIGLTLAYELAREGVPCCVLDQGQPGQGASWAGAGILPPGSPDHAETPEARFRSLSHTLWPDLSAQLKEETGIDNEFHRCGGIEVRLCAAHDALDDDVRQWQREGVAVEPLSGRAIHEREPGLAPRIASAYRLPELGQVRNPRHLKALIAALERRRVIISTGTPAWGFERQKNRVVAARTPAGLVAGNKFVITSGAWSGALLAGIPGAAPIRPLRGQIVLLSPPAIPLRNVIQVGKRYLVPRRDGRVLVGSTEEHAGFDARTTAAGVGGLIAFATEVYPSLSTSAVERVWAGLRPQAPDGFPLLGAVSAWEGLYVATGHLRAGLQLSPATARIMTQVLLDRPTTISVVPFAVDRLQPPFAEPDPEVPAGDA